ncbi:MAG: AAA family ATPase [Bacteroidales bacterium]|nr:AAA family ATPase [Bacteroidales bacterium]
MVVIGITGTLGAGKGTIVEYLEKKLNFKHFSVREFLSQEIRKRGMELNRDSMTNVANELRADFSPSYIIDQLFLQAKQSGENCIIESIRTPGEVDSLRKKGDFWLFAVDADPKIRYQRIQIRKSSTDAVSFDTFIENENREMNSDDPNKQNLKVCIERADFVLKNDGNIEDLHLQLEQIIDKIEK